MKHTVSHDARTAQQDALLERWQRLPHARRQVLGEVAALAVLALCLLGWVAASLASMPAA